MKGPIPENIRRRMSPEDRKEIGCPTSEEAQSKLDVKSEKQIHRQFTGWCMRNGVVIRHQRMDRKTSEAKGWPDFQCIANGRVCWVEFKIGNNKLTQDQEGMIQMLRDNHFHVFVTDSYQWATQSVQETLFPEYKENCGCHEKEC